LSVLAKETTNLSEEKIGRVHHIQTGHRRRLMEKDGNNEIYGLPEYLKNFRYFDENLPKELAELVLAGKFDHKNEEKVLKHMVSCKEKWARCGGPLRQNEISQYVKMGQTEYIKHLKERFGLNYRVVEKPRRLGLGNRNFYSSRSKISQRSTQPNDAPVQAASAGRSSAERRPTERSRSLNGDLHSSKSDRNFEIQPQLKLPEQDQMDQKS